MIDKNKIISLSNKAYKKISSEFDIKRFEISFGAALVLYGIKKKTQDIDVTIDNNTFNKIKKNYTIDDGFNSKRIRSYIPYVDIHKEDKKRKTKTLYGLTIATLPQVIEDKKEIGRDKDLNDLILIDKFLKKNKCVIGDKVIAKHFPKIIIEGHVIDIKENKNKENTITIKNEFGIKISVTPDKIKQKT